MNLEELQIKIGIELKELNKQLKKASDDINEYIGPKATKKMMTDNNKIIKDGFKGMEKVAKTSAKQIRKDVTKEFDNMSKDINKSLNKAFDIDMRKFNSNLNQSMNDAKSTVKSACNDIRRELNAALNVKANIKVNASASASGSNAASRHTETAAIIQSSQYTGAMITKAVNEMIKTNNANTVRLESTIKHIESALVSEFSKLSAKMQASNDKIKTTDSKKDKSSSEHKLDIKANIETSLKVVEEDLQGEVDKAIKNLDVPDIKTSIVLNENIKEEVDKAVNSVKAEDITLKADLETNIKLNADELQNDANKAIREVTTRDIEASIKVNEGHLQDEVDSVVDRIDVPEISAIIELDENLQNEVNRAVREVNVPELNTTLELEHNLQDDVNDAVRKVDVPELNTSIEIEGDLQNEVNKAIREVDVPVLKATIELEQDLQTEVDRIIEGIELKKLTTNIEIGSEGLQEQVNSIVKTIKVPKILTGLDVKLQTPDSKDNGSKPNVFQSKGIVNNQATNPKKQSYSPQEVWDDVFLVENKMSDLAHTVGILTTSFGLLTQPVKTIVGELGKVGLESAIKKASENSPWANMFEKQAVMDNIKDLEYKKSKFTSRKSQVRSGLLTDNIENAPAFIKALDVEIEKLNKEIQEQYKLYRKINSSKVLGANTDKIKEQIAKSQETFNKAQIPLVSKPKSQPTQQIQSKVSKSEYERTPILGEANRRKYLSNVEDIKFRIQETVTGIRMLEDEPDIEGLKAYQKEIEAIRDKISKLKIGFNIKDGDTELKKAYNELKHYVDLAKQLERYVGGKIATNNKGSEFSNEIDLDALERRAYDENKPDIGESDNNSLGFISNYSKGLNNLIELAKKAGSKIKKSLSNIPDDLAITIDDDDVDKDRLKKYMEKIQKEVDRNPINIKVDNDKVLKEAEKLKSIFTKEFDRLKSNKTEKKDKEATEKLDDSIISTANANTYGIGPDADQARFIEATKENISRIFETLGKPCAFFPGAFKEAARLNGIIKEMTGVQPGISLLNRKELEEEKEGIKEVINNLKYLSAEDFKLQFDGSLDNAKKEVAATEKSAIKIKEDFNSSKEEVQFAKEVLAILDDVKKRIKQIEDEDAEIQLKIDEENAKKAAEELFNFIKQQAEKTEGAVKDLFESATRVGQVPIDTKLQNGEDDARALQNGIEETLESYNKLKAALGMPVKDIIIGSDIQALKAAEEQINAIREAYAKLAKMSNNELRESMVTDFDLDYLEAEAEAIKNKAKEALDDPSATKDDKKFLKGLLKDIDIVQKKFKELRDEDIKIQAEIDARIRAEELERGFKELYKRTANTTNETVEVPVNLELVARGVKNLEKLFDLPEFKEHAEALRDILGSIDLSDELKINLDLDDLKNKLEGIQSIDEIDIDLDDLRQDLVKLLEQLDKLRLAETDEIRIKVVDDEIVKATNLLKQLDDVRSRFRTSGGGSGSGGNGGSGGDDGGSGDGGDIDRISGSQFNNFFNQMRLLRSIDMSQLTGLFGRNNAAMKWPFKLHMALTKFEAKALKVFRSIKTKAAAILSKVATPLKNAFNKVYPPIKKVANKIVTTFRKVVTNIKGFGSVIKYHINKAFTGIKSTKLYTSVAKGLNKAKAAVSKFAGKVKPILNKAFSGIKIGAKVASNIGKGLSKAKGILSKFAGSCKTIWGKIKGIFSKGASDASKATGKLTTGLKALLAQAMGFFSLYALINLGKQAITQSGQLAQAESKLTSLMRQRMGATNETVKAIRNLAKEQANLGVVSETAMVRGAEQLSRYVSSAKALQTLIPAIANMTALRGGLFATEDDAEEIATQLGEAIREGTTTPLEQSGIYLSEKEIEKFKALRTEEERAAYLADVIAKNVGNLNEQLANTPHGAIAQLKNNFKSLLGTLGTLLVNVIQPIVKWLNVLVVAANNALKALGELLGFDMSGGGLMGIGDVGSNGTGGVDSVTDSLEGAEDAAGAAEEAVEKFKGSLMGFDEINILSDNTNKDSGSDSEELDPTDISAIGGQLIPTEITEGENIFTKFGEKIKAFMDEVLEPFKNAWALLGERWKAEWADLVESFKNFCDSLASFLKSVWDNGGKEFVQHMAEIGLACGIAAMEIGGEILDSLARLWDHLDPTKNMHTQRFLDTLNEVSVKLRDFILGLGDHFESLMANGGQDVLNALGDCFMDLGTAATKGIGIAIDALDGLIDHLDPANNANTKKMLGVWEEAFHAIGQAAIDFVDLLDSVLANGGQEVINALGDAFVSLVGLVGTVVKEVSEAFSGLFKHLDPETNQFTKDFLKAWEDAFNEISDMFNSLGDLFGSVMDNGGQELLNSVGDLGMKLGEAFGVIVEETAKTLKELFEHMDPATNPHSKKMLESLDGLVDSITEFVDKCIKAFQKFMDNGGREFVNNLGDILAIVIDLAAELGSGIIDIITGFMDSWVGQELIEGVAQALKWVTDKLVGLSDAFDVVKDIFRNIVDIIVGIFEGDGEKVGRAFADLIKNAFKLTGELLQWLFDLGLDLVKGLIKGICALPGLLWDAVQFLFDTIVGFFKELFGIHSPSTVFAELGGFLIEGLVNGITGAIKLITDAFKKIGDTILGAAKDIVKTVSEKFKETKEAIKEKLNEAKEVVSEKWKDIKQTISEKAKESYEVAKENWTNIKQTVSEKTKEAYDSIKENWANIKQTATDIFTETYETTKEKWINIKDTVAEKALETYESAKNRWGDLKQNTTDRFKEAYETVKDKFTSIRDTVNDKATQTFEDVSNSWTKIKDDAASKLEQIKTDAESRYNNVKEVLVKKIEEAKNGIIEKWEEVRNKTNECIENVRQTSEEKYNEIKETIVNRLEDIKSSTEKKWEEIKNNTGTAVENIKKEAEEQYAKIKDSLVDTLEKTKSAMATKWEDIKKDAISKATEIANQATTKFSEIKKTFADKLEETKSNLTSKWKSLSTQALDGGKNIVSQAKSGLSNIGSAISDAITGSKSKVRSALDEVGKVFSQADWSLPKLKMPHIKITGKWGFNPPSWPKFSVEWYKRGGIIDGITPLGMTGGTMHMAGEAGKEMVVPLENTSFTSKIAQAMGQAVDNALARSNNNISNNNNSNNENRDVVLQLDGREFARASINSINKLQRESGRTLLDI